MTEVFNVEKANRLRKKKRDVVREARVEADHKAAVESRGGVSAKFKSPAFRARPDRLDLYGVQPMIEHLKLFHGLELTRSLAIETLATAIQFTECKRPGEAPTSEQTREHERLRALGFTVNVVDQPKRKEAKK